MRLNKFEPLSFVKVLTLESCLENCWRIVGELFETVGVVVSVEIDSIFPYSI